MMKQITLFRSSINKPKQKQKPQQIQIIEQLPKQPLPQKLQFSKDMTIKGKKNSKVKIVSNKKRHNYWGNIFRRKRIMSEYFSDSAFGSQSDTKIELFNPWEDPELVQKQLKLKYLEYEYDENEVMPAQFDISKVAFMNDPSNNTLHNNKDKKENE